MEELKKVYQLSTITSRIKDLLDRSTEGKSIWIKAEISGFNIANSGHAYLSMVEHREGQKFTVIAAIIWQSKLEIIKRALGDDFKNILKVGSEIVFLAQVNYDLIHGLSLYIIELDPSFNIGELEQRKQATILKLKELKLFDLNRGTIEPVIIQRIALIASPNTSAHADFMQHLTVNEQKYRFSVTLFPVQVQGEGAVESLLHAFRRVNPSKFDAIAFIRGGGSKLDLDPYNNFELCKAISGSPISILTGIGHETDMSVLDMVVKSFHKTPTALADYLLDKVDTYEKRMLELFTRIGSISKEKLNLYQLRIQQYIQIAQKYPVSTCQRNRGALHIISTQFSRKVTENLTQNLSQLELYKLGLKATTATKIGQIETGKLNELSNGIQALVKSKISLYNQHMASLSESIKLLSPDKTLRRGFSITRQNGKSINSVQEVNEQQEIHTTLTDGIIISKILNLKTYGKSTDL